MADANLLTEMEGIRLKGALNVQELMEDGGTTFEIAEEPLDEQENISECDKEQLLKYSNLECLGVDDEDTYQQEPFELLGTKMVNLVPDGKVRKRILREGVGEILPKNGHVVCDYNAYIEHEPEPFDSTYAFNRPLKFHLDSGTVLPGLEIAISSMKINEKSQFLVHPDLAYGTMGCLERVPGNATVLFEIEVKNCQNTGAVQSFENLPEEDKQSFDHIYDYCEGLRIKGNDFYRQNLIRQATRDYNIAIHKLERAQLRDYDDQELQQALLLKLYTNLVVAYTKQQLPRRACTAANQIFRLVKGTSLKVPVKVYFNSARALMMLNDFEMAEKRLKTAKQLSPQSNEIAEQLIKVEQLKKESLEKEKNIAKLFVSDNKQSDHELKGIVKKIAELLLDDSECSAYTLPDNLSADSVKYIKDAVTTFNLQFGEKNNKYYVYKSELE